MRRYTCSDYRDEMRLLALRRRLEQVGLSDEERSRVQGDVDALERAMKME